MADENLLAVVRRVIAARPDAVAYRTLTRNWTMREVGDASDRIAQGLKSLGIGPGDRVAALTKHTAECILLTLAACKVGAVFMPVNWRLAAPEIEFIVNDGNARFLMASTSECYGDPAVNPQREDYWGNVNPIGLRSMYDEAKRFSEACTMGYHRERGVDTRIIRIFNTYGPRMDPYDGRVVINFIRQALNGESLTVFGEGKQTRSLCYVSDLVRGINLTMEVDFHEPINLGNPDEVSIIQIAREIISLVPGSPSKIVFQPMPPDDPRVRCPDISRAKQILGWQPVVNRRDGLAKMIEFYRDQLRKSA